MCRPDHCPDAPIAARDEEEAGEIEATLSAYLAGLDLPPERALVAAIAKKLAKALDRHPTASMARELRGCLGELAEFDPDDNGRGASERLLRELRELTR